MDVVAMPQVTVKLSNAAPAGRLVRDPIYTQLNELLRELLNSGEFQPGEQFLTERKIAERFQVSRVTANKALSHLVTSGLVEFRKGVGTFVRSGQQLDLDMGRLVSFTARAEQAGRLPATRVLSFRRLPARAAPAHVAAALALAPAEPLYHFERLRLADGIPVILERRYVVARQCPRLTATRVAASLYRLFTVNFGLRITGADQTIRAVNLPPEDARLLGTQGGAAALHIHARGRTTAGPLWMEDTYYRGDQYEFHNPISDGNPQRPGWLRAHS